MLAVPVRELGAQNPGQDNVGEPAGRNGAAELQSDDGASKAGSAPPGPAPAGGYQRTAIDIIATAAPLLAFH